jgi:hypothetical protein
MDLLLNNDKGEIMYNKKVFTLFVLFSLFTYFSYSQIKDKNNYFLHSLVGQNLNQESKSAISHWIKYLYESNDSLRANYWDKAESVELKEDYCLFDKLLMQMPREMLLQYFPPYILSVEKIENDYFIKTVFAQKEVVLNDTSLNNQNPVAIIDVIVSKQNNQFVLKNTLNYQTLNYKKFKIGNIEYFVHPLLKIEELSCKNAVKFCDSLSNIWNGSNLKESIKYFVTPSPESLSRLLGFDFAYFGYTFGYTSINAKYIFSGTGNFNYKHELSHLILGNVRNKFLDEGLATFFGGTGNEDFSKLEKEFSKENYPLSSEKIDSILKYSNSKNFYVLGALIVRDIIESKGIGEIKKLTNVENNNNKLFELLFNFTRTKKEDFIKRLNLKLLKVK